MAVRISLSDVILGAQIQQLGKQLNTSCRIDRDMRKVVARGRAEKPGSSEKRDARNGKEADMGCNVSKDVKVEDQGNAANGGDTMSEEKAAEKIQASFRGYKTRKTLKDNGVLPAKNQSNGEVDEKTEESPEHRKPGSAQSTDHDELADIDLNDADLEKAAAKIQATYRNFTKKKIQQNTPSKTPEAIKENEEPTENDEENLEDIDLEDPEVEKAALKIQSTFRGYKVRKEVKPEDSPMTNGEKGEDEEE